SARAASPLALDVLTADAAHIHSGQGATKRVETGRDHQHVQVVLLSVCSAQSGLIDLLDWRALDVDQGDVVPVERLVVAVPGGKPLAAQGITSGNQLLSRHRIL